MTTTESLSTPLQIDTKLAELYTQAAKLDSLIAARESTLKSAAGAEYYYQGRRRITNMTIGEAIAAIKDRLANPTDEHQLGLSHSFYTTTSARTDLAKYDEAVASRSKLTAEIEEIARLYTGWSRFFVVTSSNGHIHSSTHCSTCRWTTTFGWLPELSDKNQAEAIAYFGSAAECLCSVCFPDAPVAGSERNMTAKERDALLAGKTPEAKQASAVCPGSGTYASREQPHRLGYMSGNWATCPECQEHVTTTTRDSTKLRKHAPRAAS